MVDLDGDTEINNTSLMAMTGIVQSSKRELEPLTREAALDTIGLAATLLFTHGQTTERTIVAAQR